MAYILTKIPEESILNWEIILNKFKVLWLL